MKNNLRKAEIFSDINKAESCLSGIISKILESSDSNKDIRKNKSKKK